MSVSSDCIPLQFNEDRRYLPVEAEDIANHVKKYLVIIKVPEKLRTQGENKKMRHYYTFHNRGSEIIVLCIGFTQQLKGWKCKVCMMAYIP